jgi:hypothetical protein
VRRLSGSKFEQTGEAKDAHADPGCKVRDRNVGIKMPVNEFIDAVQRRTVKRYGRRHHSAPLPLRPVLFHDVCGYRNPEGLATDT